MEFDLLRTVVLVAAISTTLFSSSYAQQPDYIQACPKDKHVIDKCLRDSVNRLTYYLRGGIPELNIFELEPVLIDEVIIVLSDGPDGYRAQFRNINAFGVSNVTVTNVRSDIDTLQFQFTLAIPYIEVKAQYRSSGFLILMKASGAGDYWGEYEGVTAKIYFRCVPHLGEDGRHYLEANDVKMDFKVAHIKMGVENIAQENAVIKAALNLLINTNAQELLKEMKPALKSKLTLVIRNFMNRLFARIPLEQWFES